MRAEELEFRSFFLDPLTAMGTIGELFGYKSARVVALGKEDLSEGT